MAQSLRASFQQLVVNHQLQAPSSNRNYSRNARKRQTNSGFAPAPFPSFSMPQPVLNAVRADQTADTVDSSTIQLISDITRQIDEEHAATLKRNAYNPEDNFVSDSDLRRRVMSTILDLQKGLLERETEVRLLILAALCGEHLLLLGPPGTAKSELSRRLSAATGGKYFERLLTRFSVPEELFGPLSMKGLESDEYVRKIDGYLPTAEVAFIDEIFKANSAILNALLTILNERLFDNGNKRFEIPLLCLVGASNELPESEELDALYDRFLIRRQVAQVSSGGLGTLARLAAGSLGDADAALLSSDGANDAVGGPELTMDDFRATAAAAYKIVEMPETVIDILIDLRNYLQDKCEPPIYVSDRRFMKAVRMLQVAAHADGRTAVSEVDCLLLEFTLGQRPDDAQKVRARVREVIASDPGLQQAELVFLGLFGRACRILESGNESEVAEASQEAADLVDLLQMRQAGLAATLDGDFPELRSSVWLSEAAAATAAQAMAPQMVENRKRVEDLLREAMVLKEALTRKVAANTLEKLLPKRFKQYEKGISGRV
jgi:MoxR-like ATPase